MQQDGGTVPDDLPGGAFWTDAAFTAAVYPELPHLRRTVRRVVSGRVDLDEIEQRVLIRLWQRWPQVAALAPAARCGWVRTTAKRMVWDEARRLDREPVDWFFAVPEDTRVGSDVADTYAAREEVRGVFAAIRRLDRRDRVLLLDRAFTDDSVRDLAHRHDMTEGQVRKRLTRVRARLADSRSHAGFLGGAVVRVKVAWWLRTRRVDPVGWGAPTTAISMAMTGVLLATGVPSADATPLGGAPRVEHRGVGADDQPDRPGAAGSAAARRPARPDLAGRSGTGDAAKRTASQPGGTARVGACLVDGTCVAAGASSPDPASPSYTPGDEVYVDLPAPVGRVGVTQNRVPVCGTLPTLPPPLGCEHHP